ncbi:MAG TPA: cell envelope integrity protein TolA [Steroidobacteraceae bacterium]|jgi:colicin import membrane protein|nr:cell envelope integrity protein TolA [Steroidobacteraceae bacterium]
MKTPAKEPRADRVVSIALSVLVHAAIVGALLWGWWQYRTPKSVPDTLAIQATVVQNAPQRSHAAQPPAPTPAPPTPTPPAPTPPPPAQPPPPSVDQAQLARQARERAQAEADQKAAAQQAIELAALHHAAAVKAQAAKVEAERQAREQAQRQAQLAAERQAQEEAEAKAQAELKAKQDAAREAQLLAQQLKAEQAQQAEQQRAADLQQQVQAEEHLDALESSPEKAEYTALISARISRAWIRPPSAQPGLKCIVRLTQIPGGEITHVTVEGCNGDEAVRQSVQTAAYRASPLPAPPDPALFEPNITVTFAPDQ